MKKAKNNRIFDSKIFWFILSLVFSIMVWVYVTSTEGMEKEETFSGVNVVFSGQEALAESKELVVIEQDYTTVSVRLSANRRTLAKLNSKNITAVVDLTKISSAGRNTFSYTLSYPSGVDASEITVVDSYPEVIEFYVDKQSYKYVPVTAVFEGTVAEGHAVEPAEVEPTTIKVSGPETTINSIKDAYVVIDRENVDSTLKYDAPYILRDADGNEVTSDDITTDRDTVYVTLPVLATKEVSLDVDIVEGGGATVKNADIDIDPKTITLAGDSQYLDGLNKIVLGTIDLSDFEQSYENTYSIKLDNDSVENLSGVTEATVKIKIKGLVTKRFNVTNFSCSNVTSGYKAEVVTRSLSIVLRADSEIMEAIESNNIRAVADLSELGNTIGEFMVPVKIYVDGYAETDAGAVVDGDYKVYVSVEIDDGEDTE